jgi:phosphopantothenoylcysteine decarboxylase/phosphopantothenate--cysteine ligase
VGFAAETEDVLANARAKLKAKNLDLIVANDVSRPGIGFDAADNAGWLLYADGREVEIPRTSKAELAAKVLDAVVELRRGREGCAGG